MDGRLECIAEIFLSRALTASALLGALFAVAFPELDVHAAGSNPGFQLMIPPASRLVALLLMRWMGA